MQVSAIAENLMAYCVETNRVCPKPDHWTQLYKLLPNTVQKSSGGWHPSLPQILGGWWNSNNDDKKDRLAEHIRWADRHGAIAIVDGFLRTLTETQWHHIDE